MPTPPSRLPPAASAVAAGTAVDVYRGRYAPSPTGPLHFGSVVAAVASYADARAHAGLWMVRIDDLDRPRVVPGAADGILRTLEALGMHWDGEVVYQSRRLPAYHAALHALRARGAIYPCRCSRTDIAGAALRGIEGFVYPGTCRAGNSGRARAWRFNTRHAQVVFDDAIQGQFVQNVEDEIGDFVLYRQDGTYAYHLATAVDDAEQGITDIVRGADLLGSTPRQILLQRALGLRSPRYAHVPVVVNERGEKLSKQTHAPAVTASHACDALLAALKFLGQRIPRDAAGMWCEEVWRWAVPRWRVQDIPHARSGSFPYR